VVEAAIRALALRIVGCRGCLAAGISWAKDQDLIKRISEINVLLVDVKIDSGLYIYIYMCIFYYYINIKKYDFSVKEVKYLRLIISTNGVYIDPKKICTITK